MSAASARQRPAAARVWLLGLLCGAAAAVAPGWLTLAAILLAPGLLAALTDPAPGRASARPVLLLGAAVAIAPLVTLAGSGGGVTMALALAGEPRTLALTWSAQGAAWLVMEAAPWLIRLLLDGSAAAQALALGRARNALEAEWGFAPREGAAAEAPD